MAFKQVDRRMEFHAPQNYFVLTGSVLNAERKVRMLVPAAKSMQPVVMHPSRFHALQNLALLASAKVHMLCNGKVSLRSDYVKVSTESANSLPKDRSCRFSLVGQNNVL